MKRIFFLSIPIIVFISIIFFARPLEEKQIKKEHDFNDEKIELRTKLLVDKFVEDNNQYLDVNYYKDLKFDDGKIEYLNLNPLEKQIIKINLLIKTKEKLDQQFGSETVSGESKNKINNFYLNLSQQIDNEKKVLYNLFPGTLTPADKFYLEQIK